WNLSVCALLGTHVRAGRLKFLERVREVVIVFDNDDEGQRAAHELAESLGDRARIVALPAGVKDLADLGARPDGRQQFFDLLKLSPETTKEGDGDAPTC